MNYTYEKDYASRREDGRHIEMLAAWTEYLRRHRPLLSLPEELNEETFTAWKRAVKEKMRELISLPDTASLPAPKRLSSVQRDGYRTEKWEFYPFETAAVPVLMEIPDCADEAHPVPAVFCFPGAIHNKEFVAGEPLLEKPGARFEKYPERNRMGMYCAQNGMVSVTFDPIGVGETAFWNDDPGDHGIRGRNETIYGLMEYGSSYVELSVYQASVFVDFVKTLPFVNGDALALSAHSLGTETALPLAVLRDDIKALVFNDLLCDQRVRYVSVTETDSAFSGRGTDWAHVLPGKFKYFCYPDLCASLAPMYLALNEGGAKEDLDKVRKAYETAGAKDNLSISHYPKYADPASRVCENEPVPDKGLSPEAYFEYTCTDAPDHSFRKEPSLMLLKKCFGM